MNAKTLLAVASVAAAFSGFARAGEADMVVDFSKFESTRTRAEVKAEAVAAVQAKRSGEADPIFAAVPATGVRGVQPAQAERLQARLGLRSEAQLGL